VTDHFCGEYLDLYGTGSSKPGAYATGVLAREQSHDLIDQLEPESRACPR